MRQFQGWSLVSGEKILSVKEILFISLYVKDSNQNYRT
jgi:hypothetical protein